MVTEEKAKEALKEIIDPEVGVNIVDLGLVYGVDITDNGINVSMTMTTRACPLVELIKDQATRALEKEFPDMAVTVEMVWDPPWDAEMMSDTARKTLGY
ncbi:PaaD-like protein (DUF59) involved in Fe-S cluster assembly [hydrothermal vent metagenome]|uniref:PaaD-like protein (DUF59) involved in Fe-S cluster assembly n=1 Tax=hydrothermal vent metagenome TaxID=652676 RepID=A0A3B1C561_9ZZZZ